MPTEADENENVSWRSDSGVSADVTRWERADEFFEERIRKPAIVAWADRRTRIGLLILGIYLGMALIAVFDLYRAPSTNQATQLAGPFQSWDYPLGTTMSGVDLLSLIIHSTPDILLMIIAGSVWATGVAVLVGTLAGYKGGVVDRVLMSISDVVMAIPGLPLVIILAVTFNPKNPIVLGILININYWAGLGRSLRSQVLTIREDSYVEASRTMGVSTPRILQKDIIPNLMPYVTVNFVFAARYVVFASIGLFFLGVLPYSAQNWGVTLNYAYSGGALFTWEAAHWLIFPMIAIMGLSLGLILLGQGMDRVFNPRVRTRLAENSESTRTKTDAAMTEDH
ncbi:ABC-type dipeptide/oligopeptide/nickel transport system, permease component [Halorubrum aidingense JCM 13560]|uniref:ABC-type dipeptide/oligopeptide/nickel transport system, permease component n=1 Tax=Halorubrum aidingense JCM 13560 TaxID=1230454 RepID=M0PKT8_9EURY|nr:ABC transporter permease [Halorubrum aidingense]EMA70533.1 ABC-type dipeptide/oligopeptide/nickel transport system, permease component [Halorubrum aidingense JCM 13560]